MVIVYGLTISMPNVSQHEIQWNIVYADNVIVSNLQNGDSIETVDCHILSICLPEACLDLKTVPK